MHCPVRLGTQRRAAVAGLVRCAAVAGICAVLLVCLAVPAPAVDLWVHKTSSDPPDPNKKPGDDPVYWEKMVDRLLTVPKASTTYLGIINSKDGGQKDVTLELWGTGLDQLMFDPDWCHGVNVDGVPPKVLTCPTQWKHTRGDKGYVRVKYSMIPNPEGEWVGIFNPYNHEIEVTDILLTGSCVRQHCVNDKKFVDVNAKVTSSADPLQITEYWAFPLEFDLDQTYTPTFTGPAGSGDWSSQYVTEDPWGAPMLHGGWHWATNGPGFADGQDFSCHFGLEEEGNAWFTVWYHDQVTGRDISQDLYCTPEPSLSLLLLVTLLPAGIVCRRRCKGRCTQR